MPGLVRLKNSATLAWKKHREEMIPWGIGLFFYLAFMRQAEPSRYTIGMLAILILWPIIFTIRMAVSIRCKMKEEGAEGEYDGRS